MLTLETYPYLADDSLTSYSFTSHGTNGPVLKIAKFKRLTRNVYNFGFSDFDPITRETSDKVVTNNGDTELIMGTLGNIILEFSKAYSNASVIIEGSTAARTRLYQININKYWNTIRPLFDVFGLLDDNWLPFQKGINYEAFMGRRKSIFI